MAPLPASLLSHSDLPAFQVVPPNKDVQVGDLKMPDGTPMVGPDGLLIPPARQFSMIVNSATRVYSYRWDEAMRDNFVAARAMRRDAFLRGLLEERILPTINREWVLEIDDDRDPEQQYVRDGLSRLIKGIPDFDAFKRALLDAVWFGRAGTQWAFGKDEEVDNLWGIPKWDPVHGDSCQFTFDGIPAILLDTTTTAWYSDHGATWGPQGDLRQTDRAGTALVLQRPYWRDRFAIHRHMLEKADYLEGELAGSVQGLGLRGLVYWQYVVRSDALTWMLAYMQAVGQMDLLVFNFPAGNAAAEATQLANAQKIIGKAAIACPRDPKGSWPAVEQIQMNSAGLAALQKLVADYFDRHIERLIVGQSMSSGADKGTGLGGTGRAEFAKATKDEILVYDTNRLDQTLTLDLLRPLKKYNFPWAKFPVRFKSVMPDLNAQEKVMSGKVLISVGVPIKADELREAAGYSRPEPGDETIGAPMMPPGMGAPPGGGGPPPGGPGGAPPSWMGAPAGGPPGAGGPALMSRNRNPARYAGMYYPGGGNTYIPKQDKSNPNIGFTRYADTNVTPLWAKDLVRLLDQMTETDLDGIKVMLNSQKRQVHIDVLDWGDPKVGKRIETEAKKAVGTANVTVVNEGAKPVGPGWVSLYERSGPTRYNLEEQKAFEQAIDADPFEATNHLVFADWLDERGMGEEAEFRRYMGQWIQGMDPNDRRFLGPENTENHGWRVEAAQLPDPGLFGRLPAVGEWAPENLPHIGRRFEHTGRLGYRTFRDLENAMRDAWRAQRAGRTQNSRGQNPARYHHLPHEFCSTQLKLEGEAQMRVSQAAHAILETDLAGSGRELEPHVTVRWGLHNDDPQAVANLVGKFGPVKLRIGRADYFPDSGKGYDVIYYTVDSPDLTRLNRILGKVPNTQTHKGYKPHVTVAYVKPGKAREYVTRLQPLNLDVTVDGFEFRNRDGIPTWISTTGEYSRPVATDNRDNPNDIHSPYSRLPPATRGPSFFTRRNKPVSYADPHTIQELLRQLQLPEQQLHRWGRTDPLSGVRGILADAFDELGRTEEAKLLRASGRHVVVSPEGVVRPGRFTTRHVSSALDQLGIVLDEAVGATQGGEPYWSRHSGQFPGASWTSPSVGQTTLTSWYSPGIEPDYTGRPTPVTMPTEQLGEHLARELGGEFSDANQYWGPYRMAPEFRTPERLRDIASGIDRVRTAPADEEDPDYVPYGLFPFDEEREEPFLPPQDELVPGAPISTPEAMLAQEPVSDPLFTQVPPQASNDTPPEPPPTVPPSPSSWDVDYSDPQRFADSLTAAFSAPEYADHAPAVRALATALPPLVYARLAEGRLKAIVAHPTLDSVMSSWRSLGEERGKAPEGYYDPETGEVHHNGLDPVGVMAHEMGHAVDWSEPGSMNGHYQISSTPEWKKAWRVDLASGALSDYAMLDPEEGLAEFARLLWAVPGGREIAEQQFPVAFKVFAGFGLI